VAAGSIPPLGSGRNALTGMIRGPETPLGRPVGSLQVASFAVVARREGGEPPGNRTPNPQIKRRSNNYLQHSQGGANIWFY
jgi:hypothetical protein